MAEPRFELSYVDRADVSETFADSVEKIGFVNGLWTFEFCVSRLDDPTPGTNVVKGKRYTACRLVLPAAAGFDLGNKLRNIMGLMEKQGLIKTETHAPVMAPKSGGKPN